MRRLNKVWENAHKQERLEYKQKRNDVNRLLTIWHNMLDRCNKETNRAYQKYGGRDIKVCREWETFDTFRNWALENGYQKLLCIHRKDNDGDYCPSNCVWVSKGDHNTIHKTGL